MAKIIKTITVANTTLDIYDGPIGVSCSGGADSTILLYHLMKHTPGKIHIFITGNNQRDRRNVIVACNVIEKCIQLTGNSNIEQHISYCEIQTKDELFQKLRFYKDHDVIDILYTGVTMNPPKEVTDDFTLNGESDRDGTKGLYHYNNVVYTPWMKIDKREIAEMYKEEELDELFTMTRSCEWDIDILGDVSDPGLGHCGECWWCEERKWAFGKLN